MEGVVYRTDDLFTIGMPAWCLSTVFALWVSYERPGNIVVSPSLKKDDWAIVEFRDTRLAASIVETIKEAILYKEINPVKMVRL